MGTDREGERGEDRLARFPTRSPVSKLSADRKEPAMLKIRHMALASDQPGKAVEFYKTAFGFREIKRFGLDPNKPDEAPRPSGVFLTDRVLNSEIVKVATHQPGES